MFKLLMLLTFAASSLAAQTTSQICFVTDKTSPAKSACMDLKPALRQSLLAFIAAQPAGTYSGIADLILSNLRDGLFAATVAAFPPTAVATAQTARDNAQATLDGAKSTVIAKPVVVADP